MCLYQQTVRALLHECISVSISHYMVCGTGSDVCFSAVSESCCEHERVRVRVRVGDLSDSPQGADEAVH